MTDKKKTTRKRKKKEEAIELKDNKPLDKAIGIVILIVFIALFSFALTKAGTFGLFANSFLSYLFGNYYFIGLLTALYLLTKILLYPSSKRLPAKIYVGVIVLNLTVMMLSSMVYFSSIPTVDFTMIVDISKAFFSKAILDTNYGGGLVGSLLYITFNKLFSSLGAIIVQILLFVISAILLIPLKYFKKALHLSKSAVNYTYNSVNEAIEEKEKNDRIKAKKAKIEALRIQALKDEEELRKINNGESVFIDDSLSELHIDIPEVIEQDETEEDSPLEVIEIKADTEEEIVVDPKDNVKPQNEYNIQTTLLNEEGKVTGEVTTERKPKVLRKGDLYKNYKLPPFSILKTQNSSKSNKNESSANVRGKKLIEILGNFGIPAQLNEVHIGPSVTKFEIKPDPRIQLSKISALSDNIKMELAAKDIRIEAPIPGKNAVGIEVPNAENTMVLMSELMRSVPANLKSQKLLFALGKDLSGLPVYCRLDKMPHLLIAGATGSGKSVCINTIISSYLLRTKPDEVKLVLVDPKKVEFTPYQDVPHLMWPVITDPKIAALMLKKIVAIMEDRYNLFAQAAVREINSYNEKVIEYNKNLKEDQQPMEKLPFIVVIIDELADLMQVAGKDVEGSITRITQLARASGIHLIVATQRPSTDVITGLIKSNIPSRISFAVSSSIDSRTILDSTGAEKLLGNGDMLYSPQGENAPTRLQGCYLADEEIQKITAFCKEQAKPDYDDTYFSIQNNEKGSGGSGTNEEDSMYQECVEFVAKTKKASTSSLQRRFGIGYNRAARIIDMMEENGLIGPANGSKPREVYIRDHSKE